MNVAKRMKKLKALLDVRIGPGASILSDDVKRIHLDFARKINDGHFGARRLWRQHLPRLKYHNPAISMTVNRTVDQEGPATLTIFFATPSASLPTAPQIPIPRTNSSSALSRHEIFQRIEIIDMKHKHENDILSKLLELTNATPYKISSDEEVELREVEDDRRRSERDRETQARINSMKRQEKALMDQAKGLGANTTRI